MKPGSAIINTCSIQAVMVSLQLSLSQCCHCCRRSTDSVHCRAAHAQHPGLRLHQGQCAYAPEACLQGARQRLSWSMHMQGAIVTFTKGLSAELAKKTIRVNVIAPGPVWTPPHPCQSVPSPDYHA